MRICAATHVQHGCWCHCTAHIVLAPACSRSWIERERKKNIPWEMYPASLDIWNYRLNRLYSMGKYQDFVSSLLDNTYVHWACVVTICLVLPLFDFAFLNEYTDVCCWTYLLLTMCVRKFLAHMTVALTEDMTHKGRFLTCPKKWNAKLNFWTHLFG